jgi:hypothetical protein
MSKLEQLIKQQQEIAAAIAAEKNKGREDALATMHRLFNQCCFYSHRKPISFFLISIISLSISSVVLAQDLEKVLRDAMDGGSSTESLEIAVHNSTKDTGDITLKQCFYRTERGYAFSTNIRGICPRVVRINVQTMQIVIPNQ